MRLELGLNLKLSQQLRLAPQIIQSIEILQVPAMDLKDLIENELLENEALEVLDPATDPFEEPGEAGAGDAEGDETLDDGLVHDMESLLERLDDLRGIGDGAGSRSRSAAEEASDRKLEAMENAPDVEEHLTDHLLLQLEELDLEPDVRRAAETILYNLDDGGRLRGTLEEIVEAMDEPVSLDVAHAALKAVQSLEPAGVAARSLQECLLLQLDPERPDYERHQTLLERHFDDLVHNRRPAIARDMGLEMAEVNALVEGLASLNPRPGAAYNCAPVRYIRPDAVVEWEDGEYVVRIDNDHLPRIGIRPSVRKMLREARDDPNLREYLKQQIESAKWLLDALAQRHSTLERVVQEIVRRQRDFFEHGPCHLKPLRMQEVADVLGIHVSTVSRAISEKYAQTPRGILPLRSFFSGGTESDDGSVESRRSILEWVRQIISEEDKSNPLSDDEVAAKLKEAHGVELARRTVTKYRKALNIPASRQRRVWD